MFHRRYSNRRPQNSAPYNCIICQTVENASMVAQSCHRNFLIFSAFFFYMNGFSYFILKNCENRKRMERCALKLRKKTAKYKFQLVPLTRMYARHAMLKTRSMQDFLLTRN